MSKRIAATTLLAFLALLIPASALEAHASDHRTDPLPSIRPPEGVLRHVDAPLASVPAATPIASAPVRREVVILVGGYQSCACEHDPDFDDFRASLEAAGFEVRQFGADPRFPYDTFGTVTPNAINLRDEVRSLSGQYASVHIVAHSMGGVVADQAFAQGLSSSDGVTSYVALASPHAGSNAARMVEDVRSGTGHIDALLRDVALVAGVEPESPAVRDLANARAVPPPAGVARLDLREARDLMVTGSDARDPGVESRVLTAAGEGHLAILHDPEAIALTLSTVVNRRVPTDSRSREVIDASIRSSNNWDLLVRGLLLVIGLGSALLTAARRPVAPLMDPLIRALPWPRRRALP